MLLSSDACVAGRMTREGEAKTEVADTADEAVSGDGFRRQKESL